jgi:hypothetical protein
MPVLNLQMALDDYGIPDCPPPPSAFETSLVFPETLQLEAPQLRSPQVYRVMMISGYKSL